jgi:predicted phage terminase large subunit-like protein
VVVESAGGGLVTAQELRGGHDFPVVTVDTGGASKVSRNEALSPLAEGGKVWVPSPAWKPWVQAWIDELAGFPQLPHDDRCDAACIELTRLRESVEHPFEMLVPEPYWYDRDPF